MASSFNGQLEQHAVWRRAFSQKLGRLADWLGTHELMDASVQERLQHLEARVRSDKILVAFVAEFSRGKSELINALFFADYGCRIMPTSAGRTTMCPTELGFDASLAPSLRLLPIDTRLLPQGLSEWRSRPSAWTEIALEVDNAAQIAQALQRVAQVQYVTVDAARALGFWHDDLPVDNPLPNPEGLVEVPLWRHALINLPHPLLRQGLVVMDTPGLNAVGAEPELTLSLLPQAHAVVFILGADTGVTRSDLAIWHEHLGAAGSADKAARLVVLNKIDTLWDTLSSSEQVQAQLDRQCLNATQMLGVDSSQVLAVSAQKALVAKIACNDVLLQASGLPALEEALAQQIVGRRQALLQTAVAEGIRALQAETARVINIRRRDLDDQMLELRSLRGKNASVMDAMRRRIEQEHLEFEESLFKIHALRSVHLKLLRQALDIVGAKALQTHLADVHSALQQKGLKLGIRKQYIALFERLRQALAQAQGAVQDIQAMLGGTFKQLNAEFGFSLQVPSPPLLDGFQLELDQIESGHLRYLGVGGALRLAQSEFSARLARTLALRLRTVLDSAAHAVDVWSKAATSQLDAQLRERQQSFVRRRAAVERIQEAAGGLVARLQEMEESHQQLTEVEQRLHALARGLLSGAEGEADESAGPASGEEPGTDSGADRDAEGGADAQAGALTAPSPWTAAHHAG